MENLETKEKRANKFEPWPQTKYNSPRTRLCRNNWWLYYIFYVDFEKKIIKYLPNFCYLYQPSCFVQRSVSKYVQLFSFPFFITNMINIYKYIFTVIYIQEHKNFKNSSFYFLLCFHLQCILNSIFKSTLSLPLLVTGSIPCKCIIPLSFSFHVCKIVPCWQAYNHRNVHSSKKQPYM